MSTSAALLALSELTASQWGLVTTAQAGEVGVHRLELSRLAKAGHLERLAHGVYRDAGAPSDEFEGLRTAWLAADPTRTAEFRLRDGLDGVVVMGTSAAALHGVGDLPADKHELNTLVRRQTQRSDIKFRRRRLQPADVTVAFGLPVTTIERTIADLVEARTDLSLVADVLRDAARSRRVDIGRLEELLSPLAVRNRLRKGDGAGLLDRLVALAGLDPASLAEEIGVSETLGPLVASMMLSDLAQNDTVEVAAISAMELALMDLNESIARHVAESIGPLLEAFDRTASGFPPRPSPASVVHEVAEAVSLNLPNRELLEAFGQHWAAAIRTSATGGGADMVGGIDVLETARNVGLIATNA